VEANFGQTGVVRTGYLHSSYSECVCVRACVCVCAHVCVCEQVELTYNMKCLNVVSTYILFSLAVHSVREPRTDLHSAVM